MTITKGYICLEDLKRHMGKKTNNIGNDALYESSIENASREIDYYITGKRDYVVFEAKTLSESKVMYDMGLNADCLIMNYARTRIYFPNTINTITAVVDNGTTLTVNEDYIVGDKFIQRIGQFTSDIKDGVLISGTISSDTIPDQIKNLCLNMSEVLTGQSTRIVTDSDGNDVEIRLKNYPSWVKDRLKSLIMVKI